MYVDARVRDCGQSCTREYMHMHMHGMYNMHMYMYIACPYLMRNRRARVSHPVRERARRVVCVSCRVCVLQVCGLSSKFPPLAWTTWSTPGWVKSCRFLVTLELRRP